MPEEACSSSDFFDASFPGFFHTHGYKENITIPRNPALTPAQADEPCNGHTPESLLRELNNLTGYQFDMSEPNVVTGLRILIRGNHDMGRAYSWFRTAFAFTATSSLGHMRWVAWYSGLPDISNCDSSLTTVDQPGVDAVDKRETAIRVIDGELSIINPDLSHPRRLWDILANRVIPYEWHGRTTRMVTLHIQWQFPSRRSMWNTGYNFDRDFNAKYAERLAKWKQKAFESCVPYAAISHSWAANLKYNLSPVNNQMWPIPLPTDTTLEAVRQNLLDLRLQKDRFYRTAFWEMHAPPHQVEYCWLDILCLRQAWADSSGVLLTEPAHPLWRQLEKTRLEEWAIDVPTIGSIYQRSSDNLLYLNGIGRPISLLKEDWESPFHWINRAWTLQEYGTREAGGIVMHIGKLRGGQRNEDFSIKTIVEQFQMGHRSLDIYKTLPLNVFWVSSGGSVLRLIDTIARRHASNETDKIAGLLFLLSRGGALPHFPVYKPAEDIESAWLRLINTLFNRWRWSLSIHCPQFPEQLFPTWRSLCEVLRNPMPPDSDPWETPGSFTISSSVLLENAHPLVGIQPLACRLLTAIDERGKVFIKLQILPDIARGIERGHSVVVAQWYLSPCVRPDSGEIYYLIPFMTLQPSNFLGAYSRRCSDWVIPYDNGRAYFLVCEPLLDEKGRGNWDGTAFKKLGFTWIETTGQQDERDQPFWRFFDSVYTADFIPLVKDVGRMTPRVAKEKYGKEKVYTLIY